MRVARNTNSPEDALPSKKGRSIVSPRQTAANLFLPPSSSILFPLEKQKCQSWQPRMFHNARPSCLRGIRQNLLAHNAEDHIHMARLGVVAALAVAAMLCVAVHAEVFFQEDFTGKSWLCLHALHTSHRCLATVCTRKRGAARKAWCGRARSRCAAQEGLF